MQASASGDGPTSDMNVCIDKSGLTALHLETAFPRTLIANAPAALTILNSLAAD
jgi:hypothetical protein